jgi:hypothetical protein
MRPRTRNVLATTLVPALVIFGSGAPAPAKTQSTKTCVRPARATVVRADRYVVVYRTIHRDTNGDRVFYRGCLRATEWDITAKSVSSPTPARTPHGRAAAGWCT